MVGVAVFRVEAQMGPGAGHFKTGNLRQIKRIAGRLQFGVSDGIFANNGGQYRITAYQLQPEPERRALVRRRKQK